jgi:hypothetical protein
MQQVEWSSADWRKSSRSGGTGACVEVAFSWRKSSRSSGNGACVEVAAVPGRTAARDSKNPTGPILVFPAADWAAFLTRL